MENQSRSVERIRHELKFRIATVESAESISPKMVRITLKSDEFADFVSLAYDDHCKVFFPEPGKSLDVKPTAGANGLSFPDGQRPEARDYTPRFYDNGAKTLTLDFVLHGDGPASTWAQAAKTGDSIGIGGPRGSFVLRGAFDWYLLIGDETALPAIGRRIEELPADAKVIALIEVADLSEKQSFDALADCEIIWLPRDGAEPGTTDLLLNAAKALTLPSGDGYIFAAGEARISKSIRAHFVDGLGHNPDWIKAAGYWQLGSEDFDDGHAH